MHVPVSLSNSDVQMYSALLSRLETNTIRSLAVSLLSLTFWAWPAGSLPVKGTSLTQQLGCTECVANRVCSGLLPALSIPHWSSSHPFTLDSELPWYSSMDQPLPLGNQ